MDFYTGSSGVAFEIKLVKFIFQAQTYRLFLVAFRYLLFCSVKLRFCIALLFISDFRLDLFSSFFVKRSGGSISS